ncbi:MAG: hypothetical protein WCA09_09715, partial [Burkholderiales bacterium]
MFAIVPTVRGRASNNLMRCPFRGIEMYRMLIVVPLTALLLSACIVVHADHGPGMVMAPALPALVELAQSPITINADITITTTITTGATQIQNLVLGRISLGVTTLKRPGTKATVMDGVGTKIMTAVIGDNLNAT